MQLSPLKYIPISKIRAYDVQDIINTYAKENPKTHKPASEKSLKDILSVVRQIFDMAIKNRVVEFNPASAVEIPAEPSEPSRRALTDIESAMDCRYASQGTQSCYDHDVRRPSSRGIDFVDMGDIDLKARTIDINKSAIFKNGKPVVQPGKAKSKGSIRIIDIPQVLVDFLITEKPSDAKPDGLVCTTIRGFMFTESGWKRMWESYLADLNLKYGDIPEGFKSKHNPHGVPFLIPNIIAHWLRHTFITMMYLAGVDVMTAMQQAGHADIKTTLGINTHLDQKFKRRNMDKLDAYLKKGEKPVDKRFKIIKTYSRVL